MGWPWGWGGGLARFINRGLHSCLCSSCLTASLCLRSLGTMAAAYSLWMGLVLLGVLQMGAQTQDSLQPNFQQDKVRDSRTGQNRACQGGGCF